MFLPSLLRSVVTTLVVSGSAIACSGGSSSGPARTTNPVASDDPSCPVTVSGTSVNVEDTDTGAALVFVTTGDVAELRKRVSAMATMHNERHGSMGALPDGTGGGDGHEGHDMSGGKGMGSGGAHAGHDMSGGKGMGSGGAHAGHDMSGMGSGDHAGHEMSGGKHAGHAGGMIGVHSKATAADVPSGGKIAFMAAGGDVGKLQSELRMHAKHFATGTCAMGSH